MSEIHMFIITKLAARGIGMVLIVNLLVPISRAQNADDKQLFPILENNKIGYIDKSGKIVIAPQFDRGFVVEGNFKSVEFSEGLAVANVKGKWGFIDRTGAFVIKPTYLAAWSFSEGIAEVRTPDGSSSYIDKTGKIIAASVSSMGGNPFCDGLA